MEVCVPLSFWLSDIGLAGEVVAFLARLLPGNAAFAGYMLPDPGAHHVAHAGAAKVVEQAGWLPLLSAIRVHAHHTAESGLDACRRPGLAEVSNRATSAVEHQLGDVVLPVGALELASLPAALDDPEEVALDRDGPAPGVLRMLWPEADHPAVSIDVGPAQGDELAAPPGRQVGEPGEVLEVVRQRGHEGLKVRALKEALPRVVLEQAAHLD